ncbi:MAG: motility protein A [Lachnospiraceae bacterium]|nr:motility protein A [Lachnospiraceae bacterium]
MDLASLLGVILCFGFVLFGIINSEGIAGLVYFFDAPSLLITFGGSFCATLTSLSMSNYIGGLKSIGLIFKPVTTNVPEMITKIIELSNIARKEGLLSLEEAAGNLEDDFMKKGIMLIVDGTDPELVRGILETELDSIDSRHEVRWGFWDTLGSMGPAWGMIGTLVGLVCMLQNMSDPTTLGPKMAVALITTFYGSMLANWVCIPASNKLQANNSMEIQSKSIMIEGLLSIQAGENPRVIEEKLKSFLAPKDRGTSEEGGGGEAA